MTILLNVHKKFIIIASNKYYNDNPIMDEQFDILYSYFVNLRVCQF